MRRPPSNPEPLRGWWLLGVFPMAVAAILGDPGQLVATHGFWHVIAGMVALGVVQVWSIWSEARASGWVR
jgi:hypothetical protein